MSVVKDIIQLMEGLAPRSLAEDWDNSGLQCGDPNWPVKHVVVSLDPSPAVVREACKKNADLLITHHPLIFKPLQNLILDTPLGEIIDMSVRNRLAIFSAHTNLDSVKGGLNDYFSAKIGLSNLSVLDSKDDHSFVKLVVYVPAESFQKVFTAISETGAGIIGGYSNCTFRQKGTGTFRSGNDSQPHIGTPGSFEEVSEFRIEVRVPRNRVDAILNHIRGHHPYETMAYDIYPLLPERSSHGIGRIGELDTPVSLTEFAEKIKSTFGLSTLKFSGPKDKAVKKVAVCTGSGSGLLKQFFASDADVFISGDLKFHDAKDAEVYCRGLIDVGHFESEVLMVDLVADQLKAMIVEKGLDVCVEALNMESDPFCYL